MSNNTIIIAQIREILRCLCITMSYKTHTLFMWLEIAREKEKYVDRNDDERRSFIALSIFTTIILLQYRASPKCHEFNTQIETHAR